MARDFRIVAHAPIVLTASRGRLWAVLEGRLVIEVKREVLAGGRSLFGCRCGEGSRQVGRLWIGWRPFRSGGILGPRLARRAGMGSILRLGWRRRSVWRRGLCRCGRRDGVGGWRRWSRFRRRSGPWYIGPSRDRARSRAGFLLRALAFLRRRRTFATARLGAEHVTASRTLESRGILGQYPFVDPVAGVTTGALNLDHCRSPSSAENASINMIVSQRAEHNPQLLQTPRQAGLRCASR